MTGKKLSGYEHGFPVVLDDRVEIVPTTTSTETKHVNAYIEKIAKLLTSLDYAGRATLLREIIQNMNERADITQDMQEIATFCVMQLRGDAAEVIAEHAPVKRRKAN